MDVPRVAGSSSFPASGDLTRTCASASVGTGCKSSMGSIGSGIEAPSDISVGAGSSLTVSVG